MEPDYEYRISLPPGCSREHPAPILFSLHGRGGNELEMHQMLQGLRQRFIVVSVRGDLPQGFGYAYFHVKNPKKPVRHLFDAAVKKLSTFLPEVVTSQPADPERVYLLGFSQGAILSMTLLLGTALPLKGIVSLNGFLPSYVRALAPVRPLDGISVFLAHGLYDPVFPIEVGNANAEHFASLGKETTYRTYPEGHTVSFETLRDLTAWLLADAFGGEGTP
ncbi:alpha/beta hydrolase [Anaerotalea alkaliphila]|uniref:Esterase n=1 Tax=Anaerotalea alkaliphila TaxID=2662126 RepID=A0A7X5HTH4_9FIRM|nr:esterase [Anaerotalea alkaliphila]NDL66339.1 esterase [Anaerotalea alkaliphila]